MPRSLRAARTARLPRARTSESRCGTQTSANSLTLARTGAVWKLDAKQQANRARQEAPVRVRSESEATSLKGSTRD